MTVDIETADPPTNKTINEGKAKVLLTSENVFYNPVQEFNRDLSIAVLRTFIKEYEKTPPKPKKVSWKKANGAEEPVVEEAAGISILEALSATGLRSIRYALEVPGLTRIVANDLSAKAVESIKANIEYNGVGHIVETSHEDAM